jgi:hypothetical protein
MMRTVLICFGVLCVATVFADPVDYHRVGTSGAWWHRTETWDNGTSYPNGNNHNAYLQNGYGALIRKDRLPDGKLVLGSLTHDNALSGDNDYYIYTTQSGFLGYVTDNGGCSGNVSVQYWVPDGETELHLTGDLHLELIKFYDGRFHVTFHGGKTTQTDAQEFSYDSGSEGEFGNVTVAAASSTYVQMMDNDVTMNNLFIESGCALVLNDFAIHLVEGDLTITDTQPWDQGMIYKNWSEVPEPSVLLVVGTGVLTMLGYRRRHRTK